MNLTLDQIAEIASVEREIARLQAQLDTQLSYRKQLYAEQGVDDDGSQVIEITVKGKPAPRPEPRIEPAVVAVVDSEDSLLERP